MKCHDWIFLLFTTIICCAATISLAQAQQRGRVRFSISSQNGVSDLSASSEETPRSSSGRATPASRASNRFRSTNQSISQSPIMETKENVRNVQRGRSRSETRSAKKLEAEATDLSPQFRSRKRMSSTPSPDQPTKIELPTTSIERTNVIRRGRVRTDATSTTTTVPISSSHFRRKLDIPTDEATESIRKARTFTSRSLSRRSDDGVSSEVPYTITTSKNNWRNAASKRGAAKARVTAVSDDDEDQLEDENYPEHFKILLKKQQSQPQAPKTESRSRNAEESVLSKSNEIYDAANAQALERPRRLQTSQESSDEILQVSRAIPKIRQVELKKEDTARAALKSTRTEPPGDEVIPQAPKSTLRSRSSQKLQRNGPSSEEARRDGNPSADVKQNDIPSEGPTKSSKPLFIPRRAEPYRPKPTSTTTTTEKSSKNPDSQRTRSKYKPRVNTRLPFTALKTKVTLKQDEGFKDNNEIGIKRPLVEPVRPSQISRSINLPLDRPQSKTQKFSSRYRGDAYSRYQPKTESSKLAYTPTIPALTTEPVSESLRMGKSLGLKMHDLKEPENQYSGVVFDEIAGVWNMVEPIAGGLTRSEIIVDSIEEPQRQSAVTVSIFEALADILSKTPTSTTTTTTSTTSTTTSTTELPEIIQVPEIKIDSMPIPSTTVNTHLITDVDDENTTTNEITNIGRNGRTINSVDINPPPSTTPIPIESPEMTTISVPPPIIHDPHTEQTTQYIGLTTLALFSAPTTPATYANLTTNRFELTTLPSNPPTSLPMPHLADTLTTPGSSLVTRPQLISAINNFLDTSVQNASDTMATSTTQATATTTTLDTNTDTEQAVHTTLSDASTTLPSPSTSSFAPPSTDPPPVTISFLDLFTIQPKKVNQNAESELEVRPIYRQPEPSTTPSAHTTTTDLRNFLGSQTYPSISVTGGTSSNHIAELTTMFEDAVISGAITQTLRPATTTTENTTPPSSSSTRTQSLPIHLNSILGSTQKYDLPSPSKTTRLIEITSTPRSRFGNNRLPILPAGYAKTATSTSSTTTTTTTTSKTATTTRVSPEPQQQQQQEQQLPKPINDFSVYGILPNNTVVRKRPAQVSRTLDHGVMVYGILPNQTVVRKYPNGTLTIVDSSQDIEVIDIDPKMLFNPFSELYRTSQSSLLLTTHRSTTSHRLIDNNHILNPSSSTQLPNTQIGHGHIHYDRDRATQTTDATIMTTATNGDDNDDLIQLLTENADNLLNSTRVVESNTENAVLLDLLKRKYIKTDLPLRSSNVVSLTTIRNMVEAKSMPADKRPFSNTSEEKKADTSSSSSSEEDLLGKLFPPSNKETPAVPPVSSNPNRDDDNTISHSFDIQGNVELGSILAGNKGRALEIPQRTKLFPIKLVMAEQNTTTKLASVDTNHTTEMMSTTSMTIQTSAGSEVNRTIGAVEDTNVTELVEATLIGGGQSEIIDLGILESEIDPETNGEYLMDPDDRFEVVEGKIDEDEGGEGSGDVGEFIQTSIQPSRVRQNQAKSLDVKGDASPKTITSSTTPDPPLSNTGHFIPVPVLYPDNYFEQLTKFLETPVHQNLSKTDWKVIPKDSQNTTTLGPVSSISVNTENPNFLESSSTSKGLESNSSTEHFEGPNGTENSQFGRTPHYSVEGFNSSVSTDRNVSDDNLKNRIFVPYSVIESIFFMNSSNSDQKSEILNESNLTEYLQPTVDEEFIPVTENSSYSLKPFPANDTNLDQDISIDELLSKYHSDSTENDLFKGEKEYPVDDYLEGDGLIKVTTVGPENALKIKQNSDIGTKRAEETDHVLSITETSTGYTLSHMDYTEFETLTTSPDPLDTSDHSTTESLNTYLEFPELSNVTVPTNSNLTSLQSDSRLVQNLTAIPVTVNAIFPGGDDQNFQLGIELLFSNSRQNAIFNSSETNASQELANYSDQNFETTLKTKNNNLWTESKVTNNEFVNEITEASGTTVPTDKSEPLTKQTIFDTNTNFDLSKSGYMTEATISNYSQSDSGKHFQETNQGQYSEEIHSNLDDFDKNSNRSSQNAGIGLISTTSLEKPVESPFENNLNLSVHVPGLKFEESLKDDDESHTGDTRIETFTPSIRKQNTDDKSTTEGVNTFSVFPEVSNVTFHTNVNFTRLQNDTKVFQFLLKTMPGYETEVQNFTITDEMTMVLPENPEPINTAFPGSDDRSPEFRTELLDSNITRNLVPNFTFETNMIQNRNNSSSENSEQNSDITQKNLNISSMTIDEQSRILNTSVALDKFEPWPGGAEGKSLNSTNLDAEKIYSDQNFEHMKNTESHNETLNSIYKMNDLDNETIYTNFEHSTEGTILNSVDLNSEKAIQETDQSIYLKSNQSDFNNFEQSSIGFEQNSGKNSEKSNERWYNVSLKNDFNNEPIKHFNLSASGADLKSEKESETGSSRVAVLETTTQTFNEPERYRNSKYFPVAPFLDPPSIQGMMIVTPSSSYIIPTPATTGTTEPPVIYYPMTIPTKTEPPPTAKATAVMPSNKQIVVSSPTKTSYVEMVFPKDSIPQINSELPGRFHQMYTESELQDSEKRDILATPPASAPDFSKQDSDSEQLPILGGVTEDQWGTEHSVVSTEGYPKKTEQFFVPGGVPQEMLALAKLPDQTIGSELGTDDIDLPQLVSKNDTNPPPMYLYNQYSASISQQLENNLRNENYNNLTGNSIITSNTTTFENEADVDENRRTPANLSSLDYSGHVELEKSFDKETREPPDHNSEAQIPDINDFFNEITPESDLQKQQSNNTATLIEEDLNDLDSDQSQYSKTPIGQFPQKLAENSVISQSKVNSPTIPYAPMSRQSIIEAKQSYTQTQNTKQQHNYFHESSTISSLDNSILTDILNHSPNTVTEPKTIENRPTPTVFVVTPGPTLPPTTTPTTTTTSTKPTTTTTTTTTTESTTPSTTTITTTPSTTTSTTTTTTTTTPEPITMSTTPLTTSTSSTTTEKLQTSSQSSPASVGVNRELERNIKLLEQLIALQASLKKTSSSTSSSTTTTTTTTTSTTTPSPPPPPSTSTGGIQKTPTTSDANDIQFLNTLRQILRAQQQITGAPATATMTTTTTSTPRTTTTTTKKLSLEELLNNFPTSSHSNTNNPEEDIEFLNSLRDIGKIKVTTAVPPTFANRIIELALQNRLVTPTQPLPTQPTTPAFAPMPTKRRPSILPADELERHRQDQSALSADLSLLSNLLGRRVTLTDLPQLTKQFGGNQRPSAARATTTPRKTTTTTTTTTTTERPMSRDEITEIENNLNLLSSILGRPVSLNELPLIMQDLKSGRKPKGTQSGARINLISPVVVKSTTNPPRTTLSVQSQTPISQEEVIDLLKGQTVTSSPDELNVYGKTNDAILAAVLKQRGIGPTYNNIPVNDLFVQGPTPMTYRTTRRPPPPPTQRRPLLDGLAWLWRTWQQTAPTPRSNRQNRQQAVAAASTRLESPLEVGASYNAPPAPPAPHSTAGGEYADLQYPQNPSFGQGNVLLTAAFGVTRAVTQFLGAAFQGAAKSVQSAFSPQAIQQNSLAGLGG